MAYSINRAAAQALLKRLKDKKTTNNEAVKLASLIAMFQKVKPTPTLIPEIKPPDAPPLIPDSEAEGEMVEPWGK